MQVINFWDTSSLPKTFCSIYHISEAQLCSVLKKAVSFSTSGIHIADNAVSVFLDESGIHPDTFQLLDVCIRCKVISSTLDDGKSILEKGLLPLTQLLMHHSPLCAFLMEHRFVIDIPRKRWKYKNKWHLFPEYCHDELGNSSYCCKRCFFEYSSCPYDNPHADMFCDYLKEIKPLMSKLFVDNGEIEAFIFGHKSELLDYSTVKDYPEIIYTIDELIKELFGESVALGSDWASRSTGFECVCFDTKISDFSYIGGMDSSKDFYSQYEHFCEDSYDYEDVPLLLAQNIWLINNCLHFIISDYPYSEIYVGIKNSKHISPNEIHLLHNKLFDTSEEEFDEMS